MKRSILIVLVAALVGACASSGKTEGQKQLEDLTAQINKLGKELQSVRGTITMTVAEHGQIVNNKDGDLIGHYKKFSKGLEKIEEGRQDVEDQAQKMREAAKPFFDRWKSDATKFTNPDMRKRSEERLEQTRKHYEEVKKFGDELRGAYDAMMATLRDHRLFWASDLNKSSAEALRKDREKVEQQSKKVLDGIDKVLDWTKKYNESVAMRTAPEPAEPEPAKNR